MTSPQTLVPHIIRSAPETSRSSSSIPFHPNSSSATNVTPLSITRNINSATSFTNAHNLISHPQPAMALTRPSAISIAIDPVALVVTECITVTSAMRKHARWAHSSVSAILGGGSKYGSATSIETGGRKGLTANGSAVAAGSGASDAGSGRGDDDDSTLSGGRWGLRGKKGKSMQDNPLMSAFTRLRSDLKACKDIKAFDTPALLHPFLQVIRSSSTSASITSLALIAITKFLSYSVISRESPRLSEAMQLLSLAITHCRFEASNTPADEVVYIRILKLMEGMISGPGGELLSDEGVCHIMETGLGLCCDSRFTQILQRSAEITMVGMCQVVFERLKHLDVEAGDESDKLDEETTENMENLTIEPTVNGGSVDPVEVAAEEEEEEVKAAEEAEAENSPPESEEALQNTSTENTALLQEKEKLISEKSEDLEQADKNIQEPAPRQSSSANDELEEVPIKPYSLPSIKELFRSLVELLDPHDGHYTDTMRVMALRIVDVALEVAGPSIANHPSLATLAQDTLCRHLFQLVRSENMAILNESLRVAGTLLTTCRNVLKLQQELFLSYLIACLYPRMEIPLESGIDPSLYEGVPLAPSLSKPPPQQQASSSGRSTPVPVKDRQKLGLEGGSRKPDAREAMIESIGALVRTPTFMTELFVNYDCDLDRMDLCADMIGLLSRNAFPDSATWSTTNVPPLCLDALLGFVQSIYDRSDEQPITDGFISSVDLRKIKSLKAVIVRGSAKFNENPKAGLAFLASKGAIKNVDDPTEIAKFLRTTTRLDKKVLGDFIAKRSNREILSEYVNTFDFTGIRLDEAFRALLYTFRLPGESQLIEAIVEKFCQRYLDNGNHDNIANTEAMFVLTYAIIMLNTDLYNPNIKAGKRMTIEDFARNLRGVNDKKNFDPEYLKAIYDTIKTNEIILPEEHQNKTAYDHAWKELLVKIQTTSDLVICDTNIFDGDMFEATWRPIIATLSYVFMSASDDVVFSRVITGFDHCAKIAAKFENYAALDRIIYCLGSMSTLAQGTTPDTSLNTEVQVGDKSIMVSEMAVKFGRDDRAQLASIVLFRVLAGHEAAIRNGWAYVIRIMLGLFVNSLIPATFSSFKNSIELGPIPLQPPVQVIDRTEKQNEGGFFSSLSSYVTSFANDEPPEPSEQEVEYTLCSIDCIKTCAFEELLDRISQLPQEALVSFVQSLLAHIPEDSSPRILVVKSDIPTTSSRSKSTYDPALVFILELATILTIRDSFMVEAVGKDLANALQSIIRNARNFHYVVTSRSTYYLLSLLRVSDEHDFVRVPVIVHSFSSFTQDLLHRSAIPLLQGFTDCLNNGSSSLRSEMSATPDFWAILLQLHTVPDASSHVFAVLESLATPPASGITVDNYEPTLKLLNGFAAIAKISAQDEQRRDAFSGRGRASSSNNSNTQKATGAPNNNKPPKPRHREEVTRGTKSLSLVFSLTARVPAFITASQLATTAAWNTYWLPLFRVLARQCLNPCREVRHTALQHLQRGLLSKDLASPEHKEWTAIFSEVLFPLLRELLKPEVYALDPVGMGETRVLAATALCKVFLHYHVVLAGWKGMVELWVRILEMMERLMNSGVGGGLEEAVPESLKNILLVMSSSGYLVPPDQKPDQRELWDQTWRHLDRFLPHLRKELFPESTIVKSPQMAQNSKVGGSNGGGGGGGGGSGSAKEHESSEVTNKTKEEEKDKKKKKDGKEEPAS